ncbi:MAG: hypothetical protein HYX96_08145 [Chloroflexi bacterium]|nr:hypothetical protein [Chloroflexota bacterium]
MTRRRDKKGRNLLLQALVVIILLSLTGVAFSQNVLSGRGGENLPQVVAGLKVVRHLHGDEARANINRLHGLNITLSQAYVIWYEGDKGRATVWVGDSETQVEAAELLNRMVEAIRRTGPSDMLTQVTVSGHPVWRMEEASGEFFFYQSHELKNRVVWVTVEAGDALSFLNGAVMVF